MAVHPDHTSATAGDRTEVPAFAEVALDRVDARRHDPDWLAEQLRARASRAVVLTADGVLLKSGDGATLARVPLPPLGAADLRSGSAVLLGRENGRALFALDLATSPALADRGGADGRILGLREAGALLSAPEAGLAAYATALVNWHRRHGFCANCGSGTIVHQGGLVRRCPVCGASHFPRTDPVVIMLVESDRGLLLGRRPSWPAGRYSLLAGFVAPGETAEHAVVREVREESGITAYAPRFVASQPWPFPASLMLGFEARAEEGDPQPCDGELEDVGWFSLTQVRAALAGENGSGLAMPPSIAIARFIIERRIAREFR
jgi:NAD+ diphosphatase